LPPGAPLSRQPACKPGSVWRDASAALTAIPLGRRLPGASGDLPGRLIGTSIRHYPRRPYSVLLPVGFAVPHPLPAARCALTAPFHPCPPSPRLGRAVWSLWHFPWGRPRRTLSGTVCPWSPDFPPRRPFGTCAGRPSSRLTATRMGSQAPAVKGRVARPLLIHCIFIVFIVFLAIPVMGHNPA
jgi:hypothetical protein